MIAAANAVITHDVEPWSIVGGVPARVIGTRTRPDSEQDARVDPGIECDTRT